jgi:outer membrane protein TolC
LSPLLLLVAGSAWALSLEEVRATATDQAVAVEQARATRDAAEARAWVATAEGLPAVVGFGSVNTGAGFTAFGFPRPVQTQAGAGVRGSWTLISPAAWGAARAARQTATGQGAMVGWAMVEARRSATGGFSATRGAQEVVRALEQGEEDAKRAAEGVGAQVEAGLRPHADAARAAAEVAALQADLAAARGAAEARCAELQALLRMEITTACELEGPGPERAADGPGAHPAMAAARATLGAAGASRSAATGGLLPTLSADGTAAWYTTDEGGGGAGWSTGLDLTVPLMASGAAARGVAAARAEEAVARLSLEDQERALRVALASADARVRAAREARRARRVAGDAADAALELVAERYANGLSPLTDWVDARRQRDAARVALAQAEAELGIAIAELEAARGVH